MISVGKMIIKVVLWPPFFVDFLVVDVPVILYPRHPFWEYLQQRVSVDNLPGQVELSTAP